MNIQKYIKSKVVYFIPLSSLLFTLSTTSCSDMLNNDSELVEFAEDNTLKHANDSVYSVLGIVNKMQVIADRTVLLGDLRSDLFVNTDKASKSIKELVNFNVTDNNAYNNISDYYAVINNCNYFLANVDTTLTKLGKKVFEREYAAVKTYRAWTYLQLVKTYGNVPLVLNPVLTEEQAQAEKNKAYSDITAICNYFIDDIKPFVDTDLPMYGSIYGYNSKYLFIPVRVLLGELCLWSNRYSEAANYLYDYITLKTNPIYTGTVSASWGVTNKDYTTAWTSKIASPDNADEYISFIPMESSEFDGTKSMLSDIFESTLNNNYYSQAVPSTATRELYKSQEYCLYTEVSTTERDTSFIPKTGLRDPLLYGDLRLYSSYSEDKVNRDETSPYSSELISVRKLPSDKIITYRRQTIYLMYAEALNRLGYPNAAMCVLKYGLRDEMIGRHVPQAERDQAGNLLSFDDELFKNYNTKGIHARGCGNVEYDETHFVMPQPETELASYEDTVAYQIPLVEDLIVNELALETLYEGHRYYDLMRIALRRGNQAYLAEPISKRKGTKDETLYNFLMDKKNWFLPIE